MHRLRDDDSDVVRAVLALGSALSDLVSNEDVLAAATDMLARSKCTPKVAAAFCKHLTERTRLGEKGGESAWRVTCILLPRLVASSKPKVLFFI